MLSNLAKGFRLQKAWAITHLTYGTYFMHMLPPKWPTNRTGENRTGEPRPLDWTLSWALLLGGAEMTRILSDNNSQILTAP